MIVCISQRPADAITMKNIDFARNDEDLYPLLLQAFEAEKAFLAEVLANKFSSGVTKAERDPLKLTIELHSMGGDSVMNLIRRRGVSYREIVGDVASKVGVKIDEETPLIKAEELIAEKVINNYKEKLAATEREAFEQLLRENLDDQKMMMDAKHAAARGISMVTPALMAVGGFILKRGAVAAIPVAGQFIGVLTGVVSLVFAFTGTAYSVTVPAVLIVGSIRARLAAESYLAEVDL
ncbi:MAG: hypothetical protein XXXJIFNMEKO3_00631 [Candidatus Erwinia impunctatus]|nr:hypothetical protein XXXJIFNMEKO_00631 [Culicoides impunctatus]